MHFDSFAHVSFQAQIVAEVNGIQCSRASAVALTMSTLDTSSTTRQNTIELIIISDAVWLTTPDAVRHDKSPLVNWCLVLFMTYWHKVQMIGNRHFVASSVDRLWGRSHGMPKNSAAFSFFQSARELALSWHLPLLSNRDLRSPRRCGSFNKG